MQLPSLTPARAAAYALLLALVSYLNALGNGFAFDDNLILVANPVVTEGRLGEAVLGPYWYGAREGAGLYRPVTLASFVAEWRLWGGTPAGFHAVSVLGHAVATLAVLRLLLFLVPAGAALAGAAFFAVHPVHVEAVANVVGRSEIYAAIAVLAACIAYLHPRLRTERRRGLRLALVSALYLVGLGAKEGAVMLPAALLVLELARPSAERPASRVRKEAPVWVALAGVLVGYLLVRASVLGAVTGGAAAPELLGVTTFHRVLTALTLWPEYVRLLVFPVSLSADYGPAVLLVSKGLDAAVVAGTVILVGLAVLAWVLRKGAPLVSAGIAWFFVTVLPVSNLLFPAGLLLGERTLYLPSVGASLIVAGAWAAVAALPREAWRSGGLAVAAAALVALFARTEARNPTWFDTYTVMNTLALEHPESAIAMRTRAMGLERVGERREAAELWRTVLALQPNHYGFLVEASRFFGRVGEAVTAATLLEHAVELRPEDPSAYRALAELRLRQGRGREAHRAALDGLAHAGPDAELWALVSEAYVAKGDLGAAARARRAAIGRDPASAHNWARLADILEAMGHLDEAEAARTRAREVERSPAGTRTGGAS